MCFPGEAMFAFKENQCEFLFACYVALRPSQHILSHVRTLSCLPIMRGSRGGGGGQGVRTPSLKITKIGFLSNTGPDPLKITKLPSRIPCWATISTPAKQSFAGGPMLVRL